MNQTELKTNLKNPGDSKDFRLYLQGVFLKRCKANPKYSLRAFAKILQLDPSTLSQILRGKRPLTPALQMKISNRLGLSPQEVASFQVATRKKRNQVTSVESPSQNAQELTLDVFQLIADWFHYAIFELVTVSDFKSDPKWIGRKLGISATEASIAIERLIRLELILVEADGSYKQGTPLITTTGNPFTAIAFRKLQSQVLSMGQVALEEIPIEYRDQSSMTMAISSKRLAEAKEKIKKFRREFCETLQQNDDERDAVYQLGVSFYPLTKVETNQEKTK